MNRTLSKLTLALWPAVGLAAAGAAAAATPAQPMQAQAATADSRSADMRMSRILGMQLEGADGRRIGEVHDLIVDGRDSTVKYAVVDVGGFLGIGEHRTAVPMSKVRARMNGDRLVVDMTKEQLKAFPSYPPDREPDWDAPQFHALLDGDAAAPAPSGTEGAPMRRYRRASELLGADLKDNAGNDIGDVKDVVVDTGSGRVRYGVAEFDPSWAAAGRLVRLAPDQVRADEGGGNDLVVLASREELRQAPSFDRADWPRAALR